MYYLIGNPLGHSHSPFIHRAFGRYDYELHEIKPSELEDFIRNGDYEGLNVTIPYKQAVIPYLDEVSEEAKRIGSVNTVVRQNGRLIGHTTDYHGFFAMAHRAGISFGGKKVVILGSGGTSLTARAVATDLGAASIVTVSREGEDNYQNLSRHADADILINTTPVGMYPHNESSPVDLSVFKHLSGDIDVVYNPLRTSLIMQAEARHIKASGGLYMLVAQATVACGLFTGDKLARAEIDRVHRALEGHIENIVLVGMAGCGKTTVAQKIAEKTGRTLVDTDALVTEMYGKTPAQIITESGEAFFRTCEHEAVKAAGKMNHAVIATGGGVVTRGENLRPLAQNGKIVFLLRPLELLAREDRPLSSGNLAELYRARLPLYMKFSSASYENVGTPDECADRILADM